MSSESFLSLALPGVQALSPYEPGKPIEELQRELGLSEIIKLASNESPLGCSRAARKAAVEVLDELARYPDGSGFGLKQALSQKLGVDSDCLTLGNGSNDVLELIARAFLSPQHEALFSEHAFAVYPLVTQAIGARAVVSPARDWGHDLEAMAARISPATRVIFIANPNNPTGTWIARNTLEAFLEAVPTNTLVVLDEAYFEYVDERAYPDGVSYLARYPNVIVTRTFSKAYGLAGLRVGYGVSSPEVADLLNRVRQPFNVNSVALAAATAALSDSEHLVASVAANREGMAQLVAGIETLGLSYVPSVGNFLTVEVGHPGRVIYQALLEKGVIVRPIEAYGMPQHLRVSIGLEVENARFLQALEDVLKVYPC